jgi:hypothetical protein
MHTPPPIDSPKAVASVLAMVMATHPESNPREVRMLEDLDAFRRIGLSEAEFLRLVARFRSGEGCELSQHNYAHPDDLELIDELLDGVRDVRHRLLLCRLASCVITVDGQVDSLERSLYDRMLLRWGYTRTSVSRAILAEHMQ